MYCYAMVEANKLAEARNAQLRAEVSAAADAAVAGRSAAANEARAKAEAQVNAARAAAAGLALFTTLLCVQNTVQLMTPSMVQERRGGERRRERGAERECNQSDTRE